MRTLKAAVLYFLLVFGAGFVLGTIRVLWAVPRVGERDAELMEMPIMFAVSFSAARWLVHRFAVPADARTRLGMGFGALALLLTAEFTVVPGVRGLSLGEYCAALDPVSGTVYYLLLAVFALMPFLLSRRWR